MKKFLVLVALLLSASTTQASTVTHGMTIPDAHPRLWWNTARLATAQAWCTANATVCSAMSSSWRHVVKGDSCASDISWALTWGVDTYAQWQPSSYGSDDARTRGENAVLIYDWCFDEMTTQQKSDFLHNVNSSGYGWVDYLPSINQQSWGSASDIGSNYNWGNLRNDIAFGIANITESTTWASNLLDDGINLRWATFVANAPSSSLWGGVPSEGSAYGVTIAAYSLMPFQSTSLLGKDMYAGSDYFKQVVYAIIYATTPALTYMKVQNDSFYEMQPYGDEDKFVEGGILYVRTYYQDVMNFFSNYFSSINVGKDARQWWNTISADANTKATSNTYVSVDANPGARATSYLPLDYYATGMKYLFAHKAWDTSSAYLFFQMTAGYNHGHADDGNFHIWRGGRWLTRETPGYGEQITGYGYRNLGNVGTDGTAQSLLAHNVLAFGTPLFWTDSPDWRNNVWMMPSVMGQSTVNRLESTTGYAYADVDLTPHYLWSGYDYNVGAVVHVERELLFLRNWETTVIFDRLTTGAVTKGVDIGLSAANQVNTFVLHSEVNPTIEDASHITITNGAQALRVTTLVPASPTRRVINEVCSGCDSRIGQYRIELDTSGAAQRYFLNVLQARGTSDGNITATVVDSVPADPTIGKFTVTLHPPTGNDTTVIFNKGQTSVGGTLNLAGAGAVPLGTGVQGITYTDNGPVWITGLCGDGQCSGGETCSSCQADCGECPTCGDTVCNGTETCVTCPGDCGTCPAPPPGTSSGGFLKNGTYRDMVYK